MAATIFWLITSSRIPAGLLSAAAWDVLRRGETVYTPIESTQTVSIREHGVEVSVIDTSTAVDVLATGGIWLAGPSGDSELATILATKLAADPTTASIEMVYGSWDPPGARLLDAVAVIDTLRAEGGCPWDAEQTHESLAPFLLEEAYETLDAIATNSPQSLREELGDLLMQPLIHARIASETEHGFSIDDVAGDAVDKLVRRHPHVFGESQTDTPDSVWKQWDDIKRKEKPERRYATDGVPSSLPSLSLAAKYLTRIARAGVPIDSPPVAPAWRELVGEVTGSADAFGQFLLSMVHEAGKAGIDAELALRAVALSFDARARLAEDSTR